jgi:alpha-D-ribose 1-methylphosphonate 5-triphosphate synthase subunit PhnH
MIREIAYDPVFDAQQHYRLLLDAMARPGTIRVLPQPAISVPDGLTAAAALAGFALLNADVTFYADGDESVSRYLVVNTSARPVERTLADFIFADGASPAELLAGVKTGTLAYPEEGATLVAGVKAMAADPEALRDASHTGVLGVRLQGPGIAGERKFFVSGLNSRLLEALRECNLEFPLGIDLVLADADRRIVCVPRSARLRWEVIFNN